MASLMDTLKDGMKRFGKAALDSEPVQGVKDVAGKVAGAAKKIGQEAKDDYAAVKNSPKVGLKDVAKTAKGMVTGDNDGDGQ